MVINGSDNLGYVGLFNFWVFPVTAIKTATVKFGKSIMEI